MSKLLGKQIKYIRTKRNLSQHRFGQKIGVSAKSISAYETGKCVPSLKVLEEINTVYKVALLDSGTYGKQLLKDKFKVLTDCIKELEEMFCVVETL